MFGSGDMIPDSQMIRTCTYKQLAPVDVHTAGFEPRHAVHFFRDLNNWWITAISIV